MARTDLTHTPGPGGSPLRRVTSWARRHRAIVSLAGVGMVALVVFVLVWFQPQKVFIDVSVDEALPGAPMARDEVPGDATQTVTRLEGDFQPLGHRASGRALLVQSPGEQLVRLEDFEVENGPDLVVYLSSAPADVAEDDEFARDFVDLGQLKGNVGNQNYDVPSGTDTGRYRTVVIWCRRFNVAFAAASLA